MIASDQPKRPGLEAILGVEAILHVPCTGDGGPGGNAARWRPRRPACAAPASRDSRLRRHGPAAGKTAPRCGTFLARRPATEHLCRLLSNGNGNRPQGIGRESVASSPQVELPPGRSRRHACRLQRRPRQSRSNPAVPVRAPSAGNSSRSSINFVVEQTGYPSEVVELDADLEADLGIDSIKKAQLFGELREYFDVTPSEDLTLDDFPTLRHVLKFLEATRSRAGSRGQNRLRCTGGDSCPLPVAEPRQTACGRGKSIAPGRRVARPARPAAESNRS